MSRDLPTDTMSSTVRRVLSFLSRQERVRFFILVSFKALSGLFDIMGIVLIGFIASVAAIQLSGGEPGSTRIFGLLIPHLSSSGIFLLVVLVLIVFTLKAGVAILLTRALAYFSAAVETRNAERLATYLLNSRLDDIKQTSKADLQFAITGSVTYAFTGILNNIASIVSEGFLLLVISATFFVVDPIAAVFTLVYFGFIVTIIQAFIGRSLKRAGQEAVAGIVTTMNALSDTIDAFREISVLGKQNYFVSRITGARRRISRSDAAMTFLGGMPRYIVETALILGVVILVGQQFLSGQLATGLVTVGVFLTGGVRMMASLLPLQSAVASIKQNVEKARPALDLLEKEKGSRRNDQADGPDLQSLSMDVDQPLRVEVRGVTYAYPESDLETLHQVSFDIPAGDYVAIIGPSGAGKTTLVDLLLGLILPDLGNVTIGSAVPGALMKSFPGLVAYVPQNPGLVTGTIAENIALGETKADIDLKRLDRAISGAYLKDFVDSLPEGVETSVGKQVDSLSGGQIQRIGVARALYSQPKLLILDEATSALDATSESMISASLRALRRDVTVIVIAHRLSTVQHADTVHLLEDGRITASGDFKTVMKTVPTVAEYVKLMSFDKD